MQRTLVHLSGVQVVLPGAGPSWDVKALKLHAELLSWREYHNNNQSQCPYLAHAERAASDKVVKDTAFVQLCSRKKAVSCKQARHECDNVRASSREAGHGVWYPGLDLQLSWQGGLLPRTDLVQCAFTPFVPAAHRATVCAAALIHFTEPGPMRGWMHSPMIGPSHLATPSRASRKRPTATTRSAVRRSSRARASARRASPRSSG